MEKFFSHKFDPSLTIRSNGITFNNACISRFLNESDHLRRQYGCFSLICLSFPRYCVAFPVLLYGVS